MIIYQEYPFTHIELRTTSPIFLFKNVESVMYPIRCNGIYERTLIEWCKQFGDTSKTMIDAGAHSGTYSLSLAPYFLEVKAFEPQRLTYYQLCGGIALNNYTNVDAYNVALGSTNDSATLAIISEDGGGSYITDHTETTDEVIGTEIVECRTLDSYNFADVGFIKIDVEGHELQVLRGAQRTISTYAPKILFECNSCHTKNWDDIVELLHTYGYTYCNIKGYSNMFLAEKNL